MSKKEKDDTIKKVLFHNIEKKLPRHKKFSLKNDKEKRISGSPIRLKNNYKEIIQLKEKEIEKIKRFNEIVTNKLSLLQNELDSKDNLIENIMIKDNEIISKKYQLSQVMGEIDELLTIKSNYKSKGIIPIDQSSNQEVNKAYFNLPTPKSRNSYDLMRQILINGISPLKSSDKKHRMLKYFPKNFQAISKLSNDDSKNNLSNGSDHVLKISESMVSLSNQYKNFIRGKNSANKDYFGTAEQNSAVTCANMNSFAYEAGSYLTSKNSKTHLLHMKVTPNGSVDSSAEKYIFDNSQSRFRSLDKVEEVTKAICNNGDSQKINSKKSIESLDENYLNKEITAVTKTLDRVLTSYTKKNFDLMLKNIELVQKIKNATKNKICRFN